MQFNRILRSLLLITIVLIPLLGAFRGYGYEQVKVLAFLILVTLIGTVWAFAKLKFKFNLIAASGALFIVILLITSVLGVNPRDSLLGGEPYFQGWIVYVYLYLFSLLVSSIKIKLEYYALSLVGSSLLVSALAIQDFILKNLGFEVITYADRVVSTFGQPNFYSGFLLLTLPFCYLLFKSKQKTLSYFGLICALLSIIGILVSFSRISIFLSLFLIYLSLVDQFKFKKIILGASALIVLITIIIALQNSAGIIEREIITPLKTHDPDLTKMSVERRIYIWPQIINISLERPLLGYGLENIYPAYSGFFEKYKHPIFEENLNISPVLISLKELYLDRTHNYLLDLLIFSGIGGVIVYMLFAVLTIRKTRNKCLLIGLLTYLIWIQFQNQSIVHLMYFWLIVGIVNNDLLTQS